jgi:hypothetical protein
MGAMAGIALKRPVTVACVVALAVGVGAYAPSASTEVRTLTFNVRVDKNLNGAQWLLTTHDDDAVVHLVALRRGKVASWRRPVAIRIPVAEAQRSTSNLFEIGFLKMIDRRHAYRAVATVGLTEDHVAAGGVVELGRRTSRIITMTPCPRSGCPRG